MINLGYLGAADQERLEADGIAVVPQRTVPSPRARHDPIAELEIEIDALTARGPRSIIFAGIADQRPSPWEPQRYEAIRAVCADRDLPEPRRVSLPLELAGATSVLEGLLGPSALGLACYNDHVALAALAAARDLGVHVPDRLAVVGLDATALGSCGAHGSPPSRSTSAAS
ncbi:substrate-binding domain-containing protein [Serinibacter arcticus]|uniref:substrate-binding domain-containing protein n=1 Tax=Serinibacter arcticus TaxID=1655435 RepID=UPI0013052463|nr:substrate-binding domain-containing protein [Serinibacter arcticus]